VARIVNRRQKSAPEVAGALLKRNGKLSGDVNSKVEITLRVSETIPEGPKIGSFGHPDDIP